MKISKLGLRGKATVLLGAGATRGASFPKQFSPVAVYPPLDSDFFEHVQRITKPKNRTDVESFLRFKHEEFGAASMSMESFFTQVEFLNILETKLRVARGPRPKYYNDQLLSFKQVLAAVFEESLKGQRCENHRRLVQSLERGDAVLTFNYDCLIDETFRDYGGRIWNPRKSYAVPVSRGAKKWSSAQGASAHSTEPVKLLKLHGSLHWKREGKKIALKERPYTRQHGPLHFEIIPPALNKPIAEDPIFGKVWRAARVALAKSKILVVAGYSLPTSDMLAQALLRVSAGEGVKRKLLLLANPHSEIRSRIKDTVRESVDAMTRIVEVNTFEEVADILA